MRHHEYEWDGRSPRRRGPGRSHRRHGGFDPGRDEFSPGRGFGPGGGRGPRGRGRQGRSRGDVRAAILILLGEEPRHGYDLIRAIEERSGGGWTPSPGSIYPTLQALEDEGLVTIDTVDGRKTASLTDAGSAWLAEHASAHEGLFDAASGHDQAGAIRKEVMALRDAAMHVSRHGDQPEIAGKAVEILAGARRELYRLLADADA